MTLVEDKIPTFKCPKYSISAVQALDWRTERARLDTDFMVEPATSKQTPPFLSLNADSC